ncbi:MAG: hypothetical protein OEO23_03270 [Gemmatimonadota bacterium]|nr:hypothetical protein [Gemmatimonadota bacterium]
MHRVDLVIQGRSLGFAFEGSDGQAILERLFRPYVSRRPTDREPDVTVRSGAAGHVVEWHGTVEHLTPGDFASQLEHIATQSILQGMIGVLQVHGAGVVGAAGAVLALGDSGSGKSSVAAAWCVSGRRILGDDVLFLDSLRMVHPFMKPLKVDADRVRALGIPLGDTVLWEAEAEEAWLDPAEYGGWGSPTPPTAVVLLDRRGAGPAESDCRLLAMSAPEAAQTLVRQLMASSDRRADCIDTILAVAGEVPCYRLGFHDSRRAAAVLERLADEPG